MSLASRQSVKWRSVDGEEIKVELFSLFETTAALYFLAAIRSSLGVEKDGTDLAMASFERPTSRWMSDRQ